MTLLIDENCTACDPGKPAGPNQAISVGDPIYVIDPLRCPECVGAEDEPQCEFDARRIASSRTPIFR